MDFSLRTEDPKLPCKLITLPRNPGFSGRVETLAAIESALLPTTSASVSSDSGETLKTFTLRGPGGMGKTSVANEFVYRFENKFDAVFWVTADELSKVADTFIEIAMSLGLVDKSSPDAHDASAARHAVLGWCANPLKSYRQLEHSKPEQATWLIVFDNVDNTAILDTYWPWDSSGAILITCRDPMVTNLIYIRPLGVELPELPEDEGASLLLRLTRRGNDENDVKTAGSVAQALRGYPLAIAQMSAYILTRDMSFDEFLKIYAAETDRKQLIQITKGQTATLHGYNQNLATVWALSNLNNGKALLDVLSLLDPDSIPENLLQADSSSTSWNEYPQGFLNFQNACAELLKSSLISRNRNEKNMRIHRVIQDTVRAEMSSERFNRVYRYALNKLATAWPTTFSGFGNATTNWKVCDQLWNHVIALKSHFGRFDSAIQLCEEALLGYKVILDVSWKVNDAIHYEPNHSDYVTGTVS